MSEYNFFDRRQLSELSITIISFIMIFVSLILITFSVIALAADNQRLDTDAIQKYASNFCEQQFRTKHFDTVNTGERIVVNFKSLQETSRVITNFNQAYNRCDHFNLTDFCYGVGGDKDNQCNSDGLFAVLEYQAPLEYVRE